MLSGDVDDYPGAAGLTAVVTLVEDLHGRQELEHLPRPAVRRGSAHRGAHPLLLLVLAAAAADILVLTVFRSR